MTWEEVVAGIIVVGMYVGIVISTVLCFIIVPISLIKEDRERHHNKPKKLCKNCKYNKTKLVKGHYWVEKDYCSRDKCIKEDQ